MNQNTAINIISQFEARSHAYTRLAAMDQVELDDLVTELTLEAACKSSGGVNSTDDEEEQERLIQIAERHASAINNEGRSSQISYLINNGYLA